MVVLEDQTIVENRGSKGKCLAAASLVGYSAGRRYFEMQIVHLPKKSSSWKVSIGVVTREFDFHNAKLELGSKYSWMYIAKSGAKNHNTSKPESYSWKYGAGDRIGCLMDFDNRTLEFFKNGKSCGEAFNDVTGPVFAACMISGTDTQVRLDGQVETAKATDLVLYW